MLYLLFVALGCKCRKYSRLIIIFVSRKMKSFILNSIDSFYFLFKRFVPLKTYRYAVCGGSNLVLDIVLYYLFYHYLVAKENVDFYFFVMSPHIATLFIVFPITLLTGFLLNKHIAFIASNISTGIQLYRYVLVCLGAIVLNYAFMKIFVDMLEFYPTPSKIITTGIALVYSYTLQNKFSFKVKKIT